MQKTKSDNPEISTSIAIIPLADKPRLDDKPKLDDQLVKAKFSKLHNLLQNFVKGECDIRITIREMLELGFPCYLDLKPTAMLDSIETDACSERHKYRCLHVAVNEWEIGVPPNTLLESHSRHLDKLASPEEKRQAYEMCLARTNRNNLTALDFEKAAKRVIEMRLARTNPANDEGAASSERDVPKSTTDKATRIYKKIVKSKKSVNAGLYQRLLKSDNEDMEIIHALSSAKLSPDDRSILALMLTSLP
ncbi:hypothetical protein A1353_23060 [Methylomonas methanica]|uniref:Uncharacterized protein n=1 Tax=Methylomonas methanica TaxID=421 RepID=A0A177LWQ2_METMH|nr:hypothetical protein [Methylomonas methanica]OAH97369.1 hypothetical protein A1353_23060 [Methylomonas methanica]